MTSNDQSNKPPQTISSASDVYKVIDELKSECQRHKEHELYHALDDALKLGGSALEILGALRQILLEQRAQVQRLLGPSAQSVVAQIIEYVDLAYGAVSTSTHH